MKTIIHISAAALILFSGCAIVMHEKPIYDYSKMDRSTRNVHKKVEEFLEICLEEKVPVKILPQTRIDSIIVDQKSKDLDVYLNCYFSYYPFREENTTAIYKALKNKLGRRYKKYLLTVYTSNQPIEELIPNFYRSDTAGFDYSRMPPKETRTEPIVRNVNKPWMPTKGLYNRNIALWHSHGWYYSHQKNRWEWQRPRLFQSVEDLLPMSFTIPYIIPMLENAGANVFVPRERDIQTNEVIIDNDSVDDSTGYFEISHAENSEWQTGNEPGFAIGKPPYADGINPFKSGTFCFSITDTAESSEIEWIPNIPQTGEYAVTIAYVSSANSACDAHYTVYHSGGKTEFFVNQQIGGGTWIYLGRFKFRAGSHPEIGKVVLSNKSENINKIVTGDAVRFGGGMGNIERNGAVSGRPRFVEGARYYLQYAGIPDTLVYDLNAGKNDYKDDYQCRGEWVNYLKGAPFGPNKNRETKGLGIPIDLSLAFHTDATITRNDTVVGTLMIYSSEGLDSTIIFPGGMSRLANRDFADILQTQIVEDIRAKYDPVWNRRFLWDKRYSEACRPNVPAGLLELLSHQNFLDMKFCLDPRFRFDASRSIYKAMLKFIATQYRAEYVVQPLPVSHFQAIFSGVRAVTLKWQPVIDPLEKTAVPQKYIVYTRIDDNDFDNGILVNQPRMAFDELLPDVIYSFKVTAVNDGGESFPSEILAVCRVDNGNEPVLMINGFDRVCAPATVETDQFAGFANFWDQGVPDKYDLNHTGNQFNFTPASIWVENDAPGHGASYADFETKIIPGNTFDFPFLHGESIKAAGHSFISVSDEAVMDLLVDITKYKIVDLILGEERATDSPKPTGTKQFKVFPEKLQQQIERFCRTGGNLLVSGAYVGTDLFENKVKDHPDIKFARNTLKYIWRTNHAVKTGGVFPVDSPFTDFADSFKFNTNYHPDIYVVEAPDAIEPVDSSAHTIFRYSENNFSAGVAYAGNYKVVAFGFPFEAILTTDSRNNVMQAVMEFLKN